MFGASRLRQPHAGPGRHSQARSTAGDVNATFDTFNPPHQGFRALKDKLAALRANASTARRHRIAGGAVIRPGTKDARVPALRERLGLRGKAERYHFMTANSFDAVRHLQARADIKPTGTSTTGPSTPSTGRARARAIDTVTRQHGALALAAARPRPYLRDGQHPGLHAQGRARSQASCGAPRSSPASRRRRRRC